MRADIANLLDRLGRRDFQYREFHDAFADMELWPIFEALLKDERVVGKPLSRLAEREAAGRAASTRAAPAGRREEKDAAATEMFALYGAKRSKHAADVNLRDFLSGLSTRQGD